MTRSAPGARPAAGVHPARRRGTPVAPRADRPRPCTPAAQRPSNGAPTPAPRRRSGEVSTLGSGARYTRMVNSARCDAVSGRTVWRSTRNHSPPARSPGPFAEAARVAVEGVVGREAPHVTHEGSLGDHRLHHPARRRQQGPIVRHRRMQRGEAGAGPRRRVPGAGEAHVQQLGAAVRRRGRRDRGRSSGGLGRSRARHHHQVLLNGQGEGVGQPLERLEPGQVVADARQEIGGQAGDAGGRLVPGEVPAGSVQGDAQQGEAHAAVIDHDGGGGGRRRRLAAASGAPSCTPACAPACAPCIAASSASPSATRRSAPARARRSTSGASTRQPAGSLRSSRSFSVRYSG